MTTPRGPADIFRAIHDKDVKRVREILRRDPAALKTRDADGHTPVLLAAYVGSPEIVAALTAAGAPLNVFEAAAIGRTDLVREYLGVNPASLAARAHDGWTLLHLAAFFGHSDTAHYLMEAGADPAAVSRNEMANTPLHSAVAGGRLAVATLLLRRGADPDAAAQGLAPLHLAGHAGHLPLCELLLAFGADAGARDSYGQTAADLAAGQSHHAVAEYLRRFQA